MIKLERRHVHLTSTGSRWEAACIFAHRPLKEHDCKLAVEKHREADEVGWFALDVTRAGAIEKLRKAIPARCVVSFKDLHGMS